MLAEAYVIVLSDYAKSMLSDRVLAKAIAMAREGGRPVIANPKAPELRRRSRRQRGIGDATLNAIDPISLEQ